MKNRKDIKRFQKNVSALLLNDVQSKEYLDNKIVELLDNLNEKNFHSKLLEAFVHYSFSEEEAEKHWNNIFQNYKELQMSLDRDIGLRVAIFDYFINLNRILTNPMLIETHLFMQTERNAMIDSLTGLFNRRYFDIALKKEIRRSSRYNKEFSLIILDIDDFKMINDTRGHLYGDSILQSLGMLLTESTREDDITCRYGGEEFTIILPETNKNDALTYIERFSVTLKTNRKFKENGISISGGIASYPYNGKSAKKLINNADKALYKAKYSGKDRFIINDSDENRKHPRFDKSWKVKYQLIKKVFDRSDNMEIVTTNISLGGVSFESESKSSIGTKLLLSMDLPNIDELIVLASIVWIKQIDEKKYSYGIQFFDINVKHLNKMRFLLQQEEKINYMTNQNH